MDAPDILKQTVTLSCPRARIGRVIGKKGETIKALQAYTGSLIQIDQSVEPTRISIAGGPQSLQLAVCMIGDIIHGNFKGFAMLRQLTSSEAQLEPGAPPVYVEGYGFVPPSQAELLRSNSGGGLPFGLPGLVGPGQGQPQQFNGFPGFGGGLLNPQLTGMDMSQLGSSMHSGMPGLTVDNNSRLSSLTTNESSTSSPPVYRQNGPKIGSAGGGWLALVDPEGRPFYLNQQTGQAQWDAPPGM